MRFVCLVLFCLAALPAAADPPVGSDWQGLALARRLPDGLIRYIRRYPAAFSTAAADLILTYGTAQGLPPEGIERMIASVRARARARAVERLARGDLDGDGAVGRTEADNLIAISPEGGRGRVEIDWRAADGDGDGLVSPSELAGFADRRALVALPDDDAAMYRAYMYLDLDGDGYLTEEEALRSAVLLGALNMSLVRQDI